MLKLIFTPIKHLCMLLHLYGTLFVPIFGSGAFWDKFLLYLVQIDVETSPPYKGAIWDD